jgi:hypothetical protein
MVYDPIAKKEYDRKRNARLKAEYLAKNPNYKPTRSSKYDDEPIQQQGSGFNGLLKSYYDNQPTPPPPKPKFNPNGIEAKKHKEYYADDEENDRVMKSIYTPQAHQQIINGLANVKFY